MPAGAVAAAGTPVNIGDAIGAAPKLTRADAALLAFVPPFAIATIPVTFAAFPVIPIPQDVPVAPSPVVEGAPIVL